LTEDHVFPARDWAETLIEAHRGSWAAVGPAMANANPQTAMSWANLLIEYADWLDPAPAGVREHLPGHNSAYKRALLLDYGAELEEMLAAESVLHWNLRARGHQLYLEPKAKTYHQNFSSFTGSIRLRFHGGRLFAGARAQSWSWAQRWLYVIGAPLIPLIRLRRIIGAVIQPGRNRDVLPRVLPALLFLLVVDGLGELAGYALGEGDAMQHLSDMEFHRPRYLAKHDRRAEPALS
jgi:hypothetical protein